MREGLIEYEFLRNAYDVDKDVCLVIARDITTGIGRGPGRPRDNGEKVVTKDARQLSVEWHGRNEGSRYSDKEDCRGVVASLSSSTFRSRCVLCLLVENL